MKPEPSGADIPDYTLNHGCLISTFVLQKCDRILRRFDYSFNSIGTILKPDNVNLFSSVNAT